MEDKKGFDAVEAIIILIGCLLVGGCVLIGLIYGLITSGAKL